MTNIQLGSNLKRITIASFRGIGQIMLQENTITGFLFFIGICYGSFLMGLGALLAAVTGTLTARISKYDIQQTDQGLYGFSAALVGAAVFLFFKPIFISWIIVILGSILAARLQHFFITKNIAAFTFPFVMVTWVILLAADNFTPSLLIESTPLPESTNGNFLNLFKAFGQVIFQDNLASGILFLIAILINSRISGLFGFIGALLSALLGYYFFEGTGQLHNGLFGYNAVLCAIVFAGKDPKNILWVLLAVIFALAIHLSMLSMNLVVLTFPFVLASFITLRIKAVFTNLPKRLDNVS